MPQAGKTVAEREVIFERDKIDARIRNTKRRSDINKSIQQKASKKSKALAISEDDKKSYEEIVQDENQTETKGNYDWVPKTRAEKLNFAVKQLLDRLIDESRRGAVTDIDFFDKESVLRRKAQLNNIKDLITIVRQMKELAAEISDTESAEEEQQALDASNVKLLKDAKKHLAAVGIKADI